MHYWLMLSRRRFLIGASTVAICGGPPASAALHGSSPLYEGLVASRVRMLEVKDTTNKFLMTRSAHVASENLTSIKIAFSNFWNAGASNIGPTTDTGAGATTALTASIEYPSGTFTQVTFSSSANGTVPNGGVLFSDYMTVSIPAGATFWVRSFCNNTVALFYNGHQNTFLGEATTLSATSISDQTMGGTITNSGSFSYPPLAILGMTRNASVVIIGDSIAAGSHDTEDSSASATGWNGKIGVIARSMGSIPFLNLGVAFEDAQTFLANGTARTQIWGKSSHIICELGPSDLYNNARTSAQVVTDLQSVWAQKRVGQKVFQTTATPHSTSTNGFIDVVNQTAVAGSLTERSNFNNAVRTGIAGANGFFDVASSLETSVNSSLWVASPAPPYTDDGTHPILAGYNLVASSGVIGPINYP